MNGQLHFQHQVAEVEEKEEEKVMKVEEEEEEEDIVLFWGCFEQRAREQKHHYAVFLVFPPSCH